MLKKGIVISFVLIISVGLHDLQAQKKVKVERSEFFEGGRKDGKRYYKVVGDVLFIQGQTEIYCDSAYFYKKDNLLDAFGSIRIFDRSDSSEIFADRLTYQGDNQLAKLRDNVIYFRDSITLYTDFLDYNIINKSAEYYNGGKIIDGGNTLTSTKGFYNAPSDIMIFEQNVILVNSENTLKTQKLEYDLTTKIALTYGPTEMVSNDGRTVNSEHGGTFYMEDSRTELKSGIIETSSYIMEGDVLFYDNQKGINRAKGNVFMLSKSNDIIITGEEAINYQKEGITIIYGNPLMKKSTGTDTLYLRADTLISHDNADPNKQQLYAYNNVRIFKLDFQAIADSLSYNFEDSVINFYNDPVLWTGVNQVEADSIYIRINGPFIEKMDLKINSFMILEDTTGNYNQLKGKDMTAFFINNKIDHLDVYGNSECLFFAFDDVDNSLIGLNKIICSDMTIRFVENKPDNITFYTDPEAKFIPPHELQEPDRQLKGFNWRAEERPTLKSILEGRIEKPKLEMLQKEEIPESDEIKPSLGKRPPTLGGNIPNR